MKHNGTLDFSDDGCDLHLSFAGRTEVVEAESHADAVRGLAKLLFEEAEDRMELRALLLAAQHHVSRDWPQCCEFLNRCLAVLGQEEALSSSSHLLPKARVDAGVKPA